MKVNESNPNARTLDPGDVVRIEPWAGFGIPAARRQQTGLVIKVSYVTDNIVLGDHHTCMVVFGHLIEAWATAYLHAVRSPS